MAADGAIQWRSIIVADCPAWARLVLAIEESYGTDDIASADDLVDDLRDPNVDPEGGTMGRSLTVKDEDDRPKFKLPRSPDAVLVRLPGWPAPTDVVLSPVVATRSWRLPRVVPCRVIQYP